MTTPVANQVVTAESKWPASDLTLFRAATTSADFASLNRLLTEQTQQTLANETTLLPGVASNLLQQYQANITLMKQYKQDTTTFDQVYAQDQQQAQTVAATPTLANYTAFVTTLRKQSDRDRAAAHQGQDQFATWPRSTSSSPRGRPRRRLTRRTASATPTPTSTLTPTPA